MGDDHNIQQCRGRLSRKSRADKWLAVRKKFRRKSAAVHCALRACRVTVATVSGKGERGLACVCRSNSGEQLMPIKTNGTFARQLVAAFVIVSASAATAAAQTVVVGTGNPDLDVPAVQAAVDQGGDVVLKGHFSFDRPPTIPTATAFLGGFAMVLVSTAVTISGDRDENGDIRNEAREVTTIEGGTTPFYIEAAGASVTIQGLRFIRPKDNAIAVYAVSGLMIASCEIAGLDPSGGDGIDIATSDGLPSPANPGHPENVRGTLLIVNNDIDLTRGSAGAGAVGVLIFSVGVPGAEVEAYVSGNAIRNVIEPGIDIRRVGGRAYVEGNVISTGSVAGLPAGPMAIRVVNIGSYLIARNKIDCGWADGRAKGIGVYSQFAEWSMERAIVVDNDVAMSAPEGTVFGVDSAGIQVRGFAQGNVVQGNRIRGRARAALAADRYAGGTPANNAFVLNRFDDFEASVADVFVDEGVTNTLIVGRGTVEDLGIGTVLVPVAGSEDKDKDHR